MPLLRMAARTAVVAGTATAVSNNVSRRQAGRWADQEAEQQQQDAQPAPPPQQDDPMAKLKDLGELHQNGVLTDEEFSAAKAQILGT